MTFYEVGRVAHPLAPREYIYSGGLLLAKIESSATTYYYKDHLSNRILADSGSNVSGQRGHYPYGETWYESGTTTKLKFTTYERDAESGNDYAMARSYVNRLGRFSAPDPLAGDIADPQSLNRYAYALNDPINLVDPLGLNASYCYKDGKEIAPDKGGDSQEHCESVGGSWKPIDVTVIVHGDSDVVEVYIWEAHANATLDRTPSESEDGGNNDDHPSLRQTINCAARNSSNFTFATIFGWDENPIANFFLGSSPLSPALVWATEPNSQNAAAAGKNLVSAVGEHGVRPATAAAANTRVGPNIQTLNTQVTGPRFGSTPVGGTITKTVGEVTKVIGKLPVLGLEASVFAFSFFMCGL